MKFRKLALVGGLVGAILAFPVTVKAQGRSVIAGEPLVATGTYCNLGAMAGATNSVAVVTSPCSLMSYSQTQIFDGSNWRYVTDGLAGAITGGLNALAVQVIGATSTTYNITAATTIKATAGQVFKLSVVVAGAAGQLCDVNGACAAANVIATIPAVVGVYDIQWHTNTGIRVEPGAAQTVAISWE